MVTANIIQRLLYLRYGQATGSAFTIDVDDRQYVVTAKHVVDGLADGESIFVFRDGAWMDVPVRVVAHHPGVDISVLVTPSLLTPTLQVEPTSNGIYVSQQVYFLGFPFGMYPERYVQHNGLPFPFVKGGILSALDFTRGGPRFLYVDAINNPGFSGGPITFVEQDSGKLRVAGVVSGYRAAEESVYYQGAQVPLVTRANTGLLLGFDIAHAVESIKANPIGAEIGALT